LVNGLVLFLSLTTPRTIGSARPTQSLPNA
jgi:hypothetical protein